MNTFGKRQQNSEIQSRVLLVCVYDTIVFELSNDQIYLKFQKYGTIQKLLIFERGQITKIFIQFTDIESAINAKNLMDGTKLYNNICKMNIYFSNFGNVDLKHETSEGKDYSQSQQERNNFIQQYDKLSKGSQKQYHIKNYQLNQFQVFGHHYRSKTDDPQMLRDIIIKNKIQEEDNQQDAISQVDSRIQSEITSILDSEKQTLCLSSRKHQIPFKNIVDQQIKVLSFKISNPIEIRCVYNLFSNFGNVSCILQKDKQIFIKFRNVQFLQIAKKLLDGKIFFGKILSFISLAATFIKQTQNEHSQCIYYDTSFDRFTSKKSITINPPSDTLHISGIKRQTCKESVLMNIFQPYGYVEKVRVLVQSSEKNMALVKLNTIENSIKALSQLHNRVFYGRKMQISFTKSRI